MIALLLDWKNSRSASDLTRQDYINVGWCHEWLCPDSSFNQVRTDIGPIIYATVASFYLHYIWKFSARFVTLSSTVYHPNPVCISYQARTNFIYNNFINKFIQKSCVVHISFIRIQYAFLTNAIHTSLAWNAYELRTQKRKDRQDDYPGRHWGRWSLPTTSPFMFRAVILMIFPFQCTNFIWNSN